MDKDKFKKAIIFDCDNTLWRGIVGEGDIEHNADIQQDILFLANRGVIIGLCSKNNEDDVNDALKDQILKDKFIAIKRINWNDKVSNLQQIAEELNIGLDSIVFVDDSDFEVNFVREQLPEVLAIYPHELMSTVHQWFDLSGSFTKTQQYKEQFRRKREQEKFSNLEDYLASLNTVVTIKINDRESVGRIAELTQKTNQFNLTTKRYTEDNILELMRDDVVFSASITDRFGDNGLTAVVILRRNNIDTFLMSCRIIGRNIEYSIMDYVVGWVLKYRSFTELLAFYIVSGKNSLTSGFYDDVSTFLLRADKTRKRYYIDLLNYKKKGRDYICVKG